MRPVAPPGQGQPGQQRCGIKLRTGDKLETCPIGRKDAPLDGQSSISAAFRGMVMLSGLIAIPAVALFGTGLSETVKQLVQRQLGINSVSSAASLSEAPLFVPGGSPGPGEGLAPPVVRVPMSAPQAIVPAISPSATDYSAPTAPLATQPAAQCALVPAANVSAPGAGTVSAVSYETKPPAVSEPNRELQSVQSREQQITRSIYENPANLVPVPRQAEVGDMVAGDVRPLLALQETGGTQRAARPAADRFAALQARLRELGSTYCLLESWGAGADLYRFYCKMGIGGSTNFTRSFEATDPDPVGALSKVVQQVEEWRNAAPCNR